MPELYTSRWANKELAHLRCQPVGISRGTPRFLTGYRYKLARELAPDDRAWNAEDEDGFEVAYRAGLEEIGLEVILDGLARIREEAGGLPLVLLCYERPGEWCHRRLLADWLHEQAGVTVPELAPGDLPQREEAPEMRLF